MILSLLRYYGKRAAEYERIYEKPERARDLATLTGLILRPLAGEQVLEIACGTGYWTARIAEVAGAVCATDAVPETLDLAREKTYPPGRVRLERCDAYALEQVTGSFTAAFGGFWWSHVPRENLFHFLGGLHRRLGVGGRVVFCDNRYVEGSSTPITRIDAAGNSYQLRRLENGDRHEVLKNFPTGAEVRRVIRDGGGADIALVELTYYWCVTYQVGAVFP